MRRITTWLGFALGAAVLAVAAMVIFVVTDRAEMPSSNGDGYHLVKKVVLGGEGGWDYFTADPVTHRIFIGRGTHLMVVNPDGTVVADIPGFHGVHAVELAPDLNRAFTSNGAGASVTILDLAALRVLGEVKVPGRDTDGILYEPTTKRVFTFNGRDGNDATVIDAVKGEVIVNIPLEGKPETAQTDGDGHIFVNIEDKNVLREIDANTLRVVNSWPLAPCDSPSGQAIDPAHKRLIIGCANRIMAFVDYTNGKVVATVPISRGVDANRFDPETQFAFAAGGLGSITVAHEDSPDKFTVVQRFATEIGARTMTLDTGNHNVYTVTKGWLPNTFTLLVFSK